MAIVVYTIARLRKIPFCIFNPIFRALRCKGGFLPPQNQGAALFAPYVHDALWRRGDALVGASGVFKVQQAG